MLKNTLLIVLLIQQTVSVAQLGFCMGSSGAPIFNENFGSGLNYGPPLPAGITNYTFVNTGFPNDGQYTLFYRTDLIPNSTNWLYSLDHTPDSEANGTNGKCLIVNASTTPGQFYNRTVTGLCSNTRFEFSAWVLNILNASTGGLPINVTFEIWDATDTILLKSGSTGNIANTFSPVWNQYGLVFTMPAGQTSVILKMRNNGVGGNGNDLAIDDIMFRACGEFSTINIAGTNHNSITFCENDSVINTTLEVTTTGTATTIYQWQESNDNVNYLDITGATSNTFTVPTTINTTTFYRVKVAEDIANINNPFCTTLSELFTVLFQPAPNAPISNGNVAICSNTTTEISVNVNQNESVNWYDAPTNGNLLLANSLSFTTSTEGTYYGETYNTLTNCKSNARTAVSVIPAVTVTISGTTSICSGQTIKLNLEASNTSATLNWIASSNDVTGFYNGTGNLINQTLMYNGTTFGTVVYTITPAINSCEGISKSIIVTVLPKQSSTITFDPIPTNYCLGSSAPILPTTSNNSIPITGTWSPAIISTATAGTTTFTFTPIITGCYTIPPYELTITVANDFTPNFDANLSICKGTTPPVLLNTSPNGISGTWQPAIINNQNSDTYTFTPNTAACANSQTINVTVIEPLLTTILVSTSSAFSENQTVTIAGQGLGNYLYQLDNSFLQESNVFENVSSGFHTVQVIDTSVCSTVLNAEVIVVGYPKFFSPNGDGINDYWTILGADNIQNPIVSIFDRYGKLITRFNENTFGWDGTYNGHNLPASDYWFVIEFTENNVNRKFKSHFSLIR